MTNAKHTLGLSDFIQALGDFALARVYPETHDVAAAAKQVLIPAELLPEDVRNGQPYRSVEALSNRLFTLHYSSTSYEQTAYSIGRVTLALIQSWPSLLQAAMRETWKQEHGEELTAAHLSSLWEEAYETAREAQRALYGEPSYDMPQP